MARSAQAKRGQRKQQQSNRWLVSVVSVIKNRMFVITAILMLVSSLFLAGVKQLERLNILPIQSVQIEGEFNYLSKQQLQQSALPHVRGGFFSVDLVAVRDALIEVPWVEDISIRRTWPDTLTIRVIEKLPVALWSDTKLISSKSELFEPEMKVINMNLPRLIGPEGQHNLMLKELGRMQSWLSETDLKIKKIQQDERRSWIVYMNSGLELRLGRHDRHERLHRFVHVFTQQLKQKSKQIRHIDMRYTNGFAVAWKQDQQGRGV